VRHQDDPAARLRWRARRGLLENDDPHPLSRCHEPNDRRRSDAFSRLMDLSDNDLMDLLLARKEPEG
jgi:antitoxin CptB